MFPLGRAGSPATPATPPARDEGPLAPCSTAHGRGTCAAFGDIYGSARVQLQPCIHPHVANRVARRCARRLSAGLVCPVSPPLCPTCWPAASITTALSSSGLEAIIPIE